MIDYLKIIAGVMIAMILYLILAKHGKEQSVLLSMAACCLVFTAMMEYLSPILTFMKQLQNTGNIDQALYGVLLRAVCAGLVGEIVALLCADSGNTALGKSVKTLTVCVVIWTALPMLDELMSLIDTILGAV